MVEDVERFRSKFEILVFADGEVFQQRHVEVRASRVRENVSSRIAERQTLGCDKYRWVEIERTKIISSKGVWNTGVWITNDVRP